MSTVAAQFPASLPVLALVAVAGVAVRWRTACGAATRRARSVLEPSGAEPAGHLQTLRRRWTDGPGRRVGREWWCLPAGLVPAVLGESVLPVVFAGGAVPLARRILRRRRADAQATVLATEVIALCGAVAGELRAGRQPDEALRVALTDGAGVAGPPVMAAARFGGDVPAALREVAQRPGAEGLAAVAACWQVAADRGAGLAAGLERIAAALGAERAQREELLAQLAGTRSTAVMLAVLPVLGLAMGTAMGSRPLWFLLHAPEGLACLLIGGLLEAVGLWWTARIVRAASGEGVT